MKDKERKITSNFKYLRQLHGYTQQQVAGAVHLSRCTYALLEQGKKNPTLDTLLRLSRLYEITVDSILQMDAGRAANHLVLADRCRNYVTELLRIYRSLSEASRQTLLEEARQLSAFESKSRSDSFCPYKKI